MEYQGTELELFAGAIRWKTYFSRQMMPFIQGRVLDVGAGIGSNISFLFNEKVAEWVALEPDPKLAASIAEGVASGTLPSRCRVITGTTDDLRADERFDTIIYADVLEHIDDDRAEVVKAASRLSPGGHLVILAPAHQYLFSPFDEAVGHFRRYDSRMMRELSPSDCSLVSVRLLDSAGLFLSLGNRLVMRAAAPTPAQIDLWDRLFVPISRITDRLVAYRFGKSVLAVWRKQT